MSGKDVSSRTTVTKPTKTEQNLFEEDDEFEEFPAEGNTLETLLMVLGVHYLDNHPQNRLG